jgi:GDP-4-dehydro-6-deoxy-D-mannose reductase
MKAFITGINGFVGTHLTQLLLKKRSKVFGTVLRGTKKGSELGEAELFEGDLLNSNFLERSLSSSNPDVIFHLASFTSPAESFADPAKILSNNIEITVNLLEAVRKVGLDPTIILVCSADEYGSVKEKENPVSENNTLRPTNPYAVSKIAQDFLGFQYWNSYKLKIVRLRPGNQIGPGQSPSFVVSSFAKQIAFAEAGKENPTIKVGNLEAIRDFTDVRDMVEAYDSASLHGLAGEVYNLGSGKGYKIKEILNKLVGLAKVKLEIERDPKKIRPIDIPRIIIDSSKFRKISGWKPKISIEQTLEDTLNFWRKNV